MSVAALAVLGASLGVSFLANTGTTTVSVTAGAGTSGFVFPVAASASLPAENLSYSTTGVAVGADKTTGNFVDALKYTNNVTFNTAKQGAVSNTVTGAGTAGSPYKVTGTTVAASTGPSGAALGPVLPNWGINVATNAPGTIPSPEVVSSNYYGPGDLAVVDTTGASNFVLVNVYVTNLAALQLAYSSFAFPIQVYGSNCGGGATLSTDNAGVPSSTVITETGSPNCAWTKVTDIASSVFMTGTDGFLTFSLPSVNNTTVSTFTHTGTDYPANTTTDIAVATGSVTNGWRYYDITFDTGGSFYTISTTNGSLGPAFYFTAQPT